MINARNVNQAMPMALAMMKKIGVERDSRNGRVLMSREPVCTRYQEPRERVLFWAARDANPFFHLFESLWMLGGCNDLAPMLRYVARFADYSDDGKTVHGAYGHRWRKLRDKDQLAYVADRLADNINDRRAVVQMWDSQLDLGNPSKDVPCNVTATFQVDDFGCVDMGVFNRSNDIVWGCYGANAVHFSMLLEYVALRAGLKVGTYHQISMNWHGYRATLDPLLEQLESSEETPVAGHDPYALKTVRPYPLMQEPVDVWENDLAQLLKGGGRAPQGHFRDPFFYEVVLPVVRAHDYYKDGSTEERFEHALRALEGCRADDWRLACTKWINRRWRRWRKEADDGPHP